MFSGNQKLAAIDGHIVCSSYELRVCNWLHKNNIPHEYEPCGMFPESRIKADFLANGFYIEVWGMCTATYSYERLRKLALYEKHNLPLISISARDFKKRTWRQKLEILKQDKEN